MEIQNIVPVIWSNQPVLTYKQVAEGLNCSVDQLRALFKDHKEEFVEGVHFFNVEGGDLRTLKNEMRSRHVESSRPCPFTPSFGKGAKCLKLWTCQGVARLSKLIDTQKAWALFDILERNYFGVIRGEVEVPEMPAPAEVALTDNKVEEIEQRMKKQFDCPIELAVVYVLLMSNFTVKIGMTKDLTDRIKQIQAESGLFVLNFASTKFLPREEAARLEKSLKEKYAADSLGGEFFDVKFKLVAAQL